MSEALGASSTLFLLGAYHGINPGMGWLFAVARGMQEHRARAVLVGETLAQVHRTDARGQRRHLGEDRRAEALQAAVEVGPCCHAGRLPTAAGVRQAAGMSEPVSVGLIGAGWYGKSDLWRLVRTGFLLER